MEKSLKGRKNLQFYSTQDISDQEITSVTEVLRSDFLSRGPKVEEFEAKIGAVCKGSKALAVNSATSALHLAYILAEVNVSSLVWTSPITFVATANVVLYCNAKQTGQFLPPFSLSSLVLGHPNPSQTSIHFLPSDLGI